VADRLHSSIQTISELRGREFIPAVAGHDPTLHSFAAVKVICMYCYILVVWPGKNLEQLADGPTSLREVAREGYLLRLALQSAVAFAVQ
jgi:hypothetical protein